MNIEPADLLAKMLLRHKTDQNEILWEIKARHSEADFLEAREMIGKTMAAIYLDALYHIFKEHPGLRPDEYIWEEFEGR